MGERGFTPVEMLLSISIITLLAGLSLPVYYGFQTRNDLQDSIQTIAETLRRGETYARSGNGDSAWSVEIQAATITLFKGTSFSGRDTTYDEALTLPTSLTASGLAEVQFAKLTGLPNTTGTITLTTNMSETDTVTINSKGSVDD